MEPIITQGKILQPTLSAGKRKEEVPSLYSVPSAEKLITDARRGKTVANQLPSLVWRSRLIG